MSNGVAWRNRRRRNLKKHGKNSKYAKVPEDDLDSIVREDIN